MKHHRSPTELASADTDEAILATVRQSIRGYRDAQAAYQRSGDGLQLLWELNAIENLCLPDDWLEHPAKVAKLHQIWEEEGRSI